jgi:membrane protease subunit HflK
VKTLHWLLLILLLVYLSTGLVQVRPEEKAVVRRFGKVVARPGPGLWVGLPYGIDRVDRVPVASVRRVVVGYQPDGDTGEMPTPPGQLLTGDQNLVNVQVVIDYQVSPADGALDDYVMNRDRADAVLTRATEAALAEWVAGRPVDTVLLTGNAALPSWLVGKVQGRIDPYRLGVRVQQASVAYLAPPDEVKPSFDAVNRAQTGIRTQENRARQEALHRLREAESYRFKLEQLAKAYEDEKLGLAKADAEAFAKRLEQYRRLGKDNPDVLTAIWWDEIGRLLVRLKERGRVDLLDNYLAGDELDITQFLPPRKK